MLLGGHTRSRSMVFPGKEGKGGHSAEVCWPSWRPYRRVPLVFLGPGVENKPGRQLEPDGHSPNPDLSFEHLRRPGGKWQKDARGGKLRLQSAAHWRISLYGKERERAGRWRRRPVHLLGPLPWGICPEGRGEKVWPVTVDGDVALDLGRPGLGEGWRRIARDCPHTGHQSGVGAVYREDMEKR